jgi:acyl-CoA synthetase (NDP forming)
VPPLSPETAAALRTFLPAAASVGNPVDMIASATADQYERAIELILADRAIDSLLVIFIPPLVTAAERVAAAIRSAVARQLPRTGACEPGDGRKPVLATFMGAQGPVPLSPVPSYMFPESAAVALARVTQYGEWLQKPVAEVPTFADADREVARRLVSRALSAGGGWLPPLDAHALLESFGIRTAPSRLVRTADEAVRAAAVLGFPVVLKAVGQTVVHKTELGGVRLNLRDEQSVRAAMADFEAQLATRLEAVLVQPMITGGVEMVIGAITDPSFGPLVMAGTGGVLVELLGDTVFRMCPLTGADAEEMVEEMKGHVLLRGYRGAPPADEAAFRSMLLRVSQLVESCPEIQEMDLNPVMVLPSGAVAADVRVRIGPRPGPIKGRRISY